MKNNYYSNYFKSINRGLEESVYHLNQQLSEPELFFQKTKGILKRLRETNGKIYFFGNGASAAFANHMALDFSKNGKILSRSLSDSALLTALSNDYSYENAMLEFLKIEGVTKDDLIITISSSGNSPNIVKKRQ
jgi:D-sedoheptulose 7-phosphate isomerase